MVPPETVPTYRCSWSVTGRLKQANADADVTMSRREVLVFWKDDHWDSPQQGLGHCQVAETLYVMNSVFHFPLLNISMEEIYLLL